MLQIITDYIVQYRDKKMFLTHRDSAVILATNASDPLVQSGRAKKFYAATTSDANIDDNINAIDFYGKITGTFKVLAKSVREWDYSKPIGQRLISQTTSDNWDSFSKLSNDYHW